MFANPWAILGLLLVVRLVMGFQFQAIASMTPAIAVDVGLDFAQLGTLVGFYMLPGMFIAIPGAILGSRFKDLTMVLFGLGIMALGGVIAGLADSFFLLALVKRCRCRCAKHLRGQDGCRLVRYKIRRHCHGHPVVRLARGGRDCVA